MTVVALAARQRYPLAETVDWLLAAQCRDGLIPWFAEGHADPWNHVEAAMALAVAGEFAAARRALMWLAANQNGDGSWWSKYSADSRADRARVDTNAVAYLACGARLYLLASDDRQFVEDLFPCLQRALDYVCDWHSADGLLPWAIDAGHSPAQGSLLAASSSVRMSLAAGVELAELFGLDRPRWRAARARLETLISGHEDRFIDKSEFAMDWYYPVLAGALGRAEAQMRLEARRSEFFVPGDGVLCRCDGRWVTAAETAECAIAYWRAGLTKTAGEIFDCVAGLRDYDGSYMTGYVLPDGNQFPPDERTTYSAAAVVLAQDVFSNGAAASLFAPLG